MKGLLLLLYHVQGYRPSVEMYLIMLNLYYQASSLTHQIRMVSWSQHPVLLSQAFFPPSGLLSHTLSLFTALALIALMVMKQHM